jgi:hypothetical protein
MSRRTRNAFLATKSLVPVLSVVKHCLRGDNAQGSATDIPGGIEITSARNATQSARLIASHLPQRCLCNLLKGAVCFQGKLLASGDFPAQRAKQASKGRS